jgi:hypothetical protein
MEQLENIVESDFILHTALAVGSKDEGPLVLSVLQAAYLVSLPYV